MPNGKEDKERQDTGNAKNARNTRNTSPVNSGLVRQWYWGSGFSPSPVLLMAGGDESCDVFLDVLRASQGRLEGLIPCRGQASTNQL